MQFFSHLCQSFSKGSSVNDSPSVRVNKSWIRHLAAAGVLLVFIVDFLTPLGFADGLLYLPVLFLAALTENRQWVLRTGFLSLLLCSLGAVFSPMPESGSLAAVIFNRLFGIVAIAIVTVLVIRTMRQRQKIHQLSSRLSHTQMRNRRWHTLLEMISEESGIGYWWYDVPSEQMHWSMLISRLHGLLPGEIPDIEVAFRMYYPEPGLGRLRAAFHECLAQGRPYDEEVTMQTPDGRSMLIRTCGQRLTTENGAPREAVGILHNLEPALEATKNFANNYQNLQKQLDELPIIVWSAQPDGAIDYFNQKLSAFSGLSMELLSVPGQWVTLLHPEDQQSCISGWIQAVESARPFETKVRIRRYDGVYRWHWMQASPTKDRQGHVTKWYGSAVEIPEAAVTA